jgi:hypothetical protein
MVVLDSSTGVRMNQTSVSQSVGIALPRNSGLFSDSVYQAYQFLRVGFSGCYTPIRARH